MRNRATGNQIIKSICLFCGNEFVKYSNSQKFCCSDHLIQWKNKEKDKKETKICPYCGEKYRPKQNRSFTCGDGRCRTRYWREKRSRE